MSRRFEAVTKLKIGWSEPQDIALHVGQQPQPITKTPSFVTATVLAGWPTCEILVSFES
jgi:hypothetical protein